MLENHSFGLFKAIFWTFSWKWDFFPKLLGNNKRWFWRRLGGFKDCIYAYLIDFEPNKISDFWSLFMKKSCFQALKTLRFWTFSQKWKFWLKLPRNDKKWFAEAFWVPKHCIYAYLIDFGRKKILSFWSFFHEYC